MENTKEEYFHHFCLKKAFIDMELNLDKDDKIFKLFNDLFELLHMTYILCNIKNKNHFENLPCVLFNILNNYNDFKSKYDYIKCSDYGIFDYCSNDIIKQINKNKSLDYYKTLCIVLENEFITLKRNKSI